MKYHIIVNPLSGKGQGKKALRAVETILVGKQIDYEVHMTESKGHGTEIARELSREPDTVIIALGGDGSCSEVLNGIENFENVTLGFIPCGTGNDYAHAARIPGDYAKAMKLILEGEVGYADFLEVGDRRCLNVCGAGMDVDVLVRYASMKHFTGKIKYLASLIDTLLHLRFHKIKLTREDGTEEEHSVFLVSLCNGKYIGGGMPIGPDADPYDGFMDVVVVDEIKPSKVLGLLMKFLNGGKHVKMPCTEVIRCKKACVEILDDGKVQIDGEVMEEKVLDCRVVSGKLKTFIPKGKTKKEQ